MTEYKHTIDGITYKVITEKHRGKESFADFYSNKKTSKSSPFNTQSSAQFLNNDALSADKGTNKKENIQSVGEKKQDGLRFRFSNTSEDFKNIQKRAVEEKGIVMPGLKTAEVKVVDVPKHDFTGDKPISQARSWAKENIVGEHSMYNGDKYNISNNAIDKYLSSSATGENKSDNLGVHLAVLKSLHKVIDESIDAEIHPDYSKVDGTRSAENEVGNKELLVHRMYGAVNIDGTLYRVKTTMHEYLPNSGNINSPHSYEVTKIELLENQTALGARSLNPKKEDISLGTANLLKGVEKSYDKGKYLLDESEDLTNGEANSNLEIATDGIPSSPISHAIVLGKRMNTEIHVVHDSDFAAGDERIGKKGWYDTNTKEVYINADHCTGMRDAEQTVLHETVGHKGLRALMGEKGYADKKKVLDYINPSAPIADATYNQELLSAAKVINNSYSPSILDENIPKDFWHPIWSKIETAPEVRFIIRI